METSGAENYAAKEFLQEVLAYGSVAQTKVEREEAESRGIKKKTLWNAKKELETDSVKIGNHGSGCCLNNTLRWQDYHLFKNREPLLSLEREP